MKRIVLGIAILMGVSIATTTVAGGKEGNEKEVTVSPLNGAKFRLAFKNTESRSSVIIKDEVGTVLFSESVARSNDYVKIFDFSTLRDGKYTFVIANGKEKTEKPFEIATNTTRVITAAE